VLWVYYFTLEPDLINPVHIFKIIQSSATDAKGSQTPWHGPHGILPTTELSPPAVAPTSVNLTAAAQMTSASTTYHCRSTLYRVNKKDSITG